MKSQRIAVLLSSVNIVILGLILLRVSSAPALADTGSQQQVSVLRGTALELVDRQNQVRASIDVDTSGDVLLRLRDRTGAIRVKLGAGESGSGLLLVEASEPAVHVIARRTGTAERPTTTRVTLRAADGQERVIRP